MKNPDDYRPGVGIFLRNNEGKVFAAKRIDNTSEAWQMPQGGIDEGETPHEAMLRELMEEIGVGANKVEVTDEISDWLYYDLPQHLTSVLWKGRYKGQRQKWFALKFLGSDADINICTDIPEFCEWKWVEAKELPKIIVPFKRNLYEKIIKEFS